MNIVRITDSSRTSIRTSLATALQSFPKVINVLVETVEPSLAWRTNGSVFQYTRFETLRGMLGGTIIDTPPQGQPFNCLWATSSFHLNDSEEFVRGKEVLRSALNNLPEESLSRSMRQALADCNGLDVYCACFSAVEDDLSQWRGYGDNGAGVCLEFSLNDLIAGINGVGYWVIYGKPSDPLIQPEVANKLVSYIHDSIASLLPTAPTLADYREIRKQLFTIWPTLSLAFKHSAFRAEEEFRIVYSDAVGEPVSPSFRPNPFVPFVKLKMRGGEQLPLRSVRLGPAVSSDLNHKSVRLALDNLGLKEIDVHRSDIPYVPK